MNLEEMVKEYGYSDKGYTVLETVKCDILNCSFPPALMYESAKEQLGEYSANLIFEIDSYDGDQLFSIHLEQVVRKAVNDGWIVICADGFFTTAEIY